MEEEADFMNLSDTVKAILLWPFRLKNHPADFWIRLYVLDNFRFWKNVSWLKHCLDLQWITVYLLKFSYLLLQVHPGSVLFLPSTNTDEIDTIKQIKINQIN